MSPAEVGILVGLTVFGSLVGFGWGVIWERERRCPPQPREAPVERAVREDHDLWAIASRELGMDKHGRMTTNRRDA